MIDITKEDVYSLSELIKQLEIIKSQGDGVLNFPKAFYCICQEIQSIKEHIVRIDKEIENIWNDILDYDP